MMFMDLLDNNLAADEVDDDGEDVEDGEDASENEVTAPGSTLVQSVSRLMLLTPRRLRRTYATEYSVFQTVWPKVVS